MGINDAGQIIATASRAGGGVYPSWGVLLTPVPAPPAAPARVTLLLAAASSRRVRSLRDILRLSLTRWR